MPLANPLTADSPFLQLRSHHLDTLNIQIEEYEHRVTGARHFHLACDNPENVFTVAFRTVPMDSSGVAHILEHTALCGSRKFPIRDPFFMMIRRSMNTFMNAMTSSDWTAYPFASQNLKDFNNLLEVYLDAVFFSNLDPLDFAQEGHRLEFSDSKDPNSTLEYKGVVYNEMKGAMSSINSLIWQQLCKHLFPTTTYHYNSGGDPVDIPTLTYEKLLSFYKTHYHPSNAIFMTFGDIPAADHQQRFEELALNQFEKLDVHIAVGDEQRYPAPIKVEETYPLDEDSAEHKTHVIMAWLLGNNTNLEELYKAQLLTSVLLDNSASPLLQALETTALGSNPSPLCGLEDSHREMSLICGLEGCDSASSEDVEALILDTLQQVAEHGIDQDKVEAALHSLELHQREITGDSYPYGLQLILSALSSATHRGDPIELLDIDPVLKQLKQDIRDPQYIPKLIRQYLLENPHRVTLTVQPDRDLAAKTLAEEQARLANIKNSLSEAQRAEIIAQSEALKIRQEQEDDASILPKVELSDVPASINWPQAKRSKLNQLDLAYYKQGTNGLSYQDILVRLPAIPEELRGCLPYYSACLPELGIGKRSYLEIQALQAAISGGIHAQFNLRSRIGDEQALEAYLLVGSKALYSNQAALSQLMRETLYECRFDELERIHELMRQIASHKEQSVISQGHALAMGIASSQMSPIAALNYHNSGLRGIKTLKELVHSFGEEAALQNFADKLQALHQLINTGNKQLLCIAEESEESSLQTALAQHWSSTENSAVSNFSLPETREQVHQAWLCNSQVNFCALAFPTVPAGHADAAALTVLAGFLRNGFLHSAIREKGGAYGAGAGQDSNSASFRFFSYRDPRLSETLADFRRSLDWLQNDKHDESKLEEAILGVISSLDRPASPAGTAKQAYYNELFGRDQHYRARFRQAVLELDIARLQAVAETYLQPDKASTGLVSHKACQKELEKLNVHIFKL